MVNVSIIVRIVSSLTGSLRPTMGHYGYTMMMMMMVLMLMLMLMMMMMMMMMSASQKSQDGVQ